MTHFEIWFVRNHIACTKCITSKDGLTIQSKTRLFNIAIFFQIIIFHIHHCIAVFLPLYLRTFISPTKLWKNTMIKIVVICSQKKKFLKSNGCSSICKYASCHIPRKWPEIRHFRYGEPVFFVNFLKNISIFFSIKTCLRSYLWRRFVFFETCSEKTA